MNSFFLRVFGTRNTVYFRSVLFMQRAIQNIPKKHMHNNVVDFEKYFRKCLTTIKISKIKPFENFPLYSSYVILIIMLHLVAS